MPRYSDKQRAAMEALMRDEVYRTAVEILTREGLQALTIDRLAKAIGVARGTLYNYFADRDAVLTYVEERAARPVFDELEQIAVREAPAEEKLRGFTLAAFRFVESSRPLIYTLYRIKQIEGTLREAQLRRRHRLITLVTTVLEQGMAHGEFRRLPLPDAAIVFSSVIAGHIEYMADYDIVRPAEEIASTLLDVILPAFRVLPMEPSSK